MFVEGISDIPKCDSIELTCNSEFNYERTEFNLSISLLFVLNIISLSVVFVI